MSNKVNVDEVCLHSVDRKLCAKFIGAIVAKVPEGDVVSSEVAKAASSFNVLKQLVADGSVEVRIVHGITWLESNCACPTPENCGEVATLFVHQPYNPYHLNICTSSGVFEHDEYVEVTGSFIYDDVDEEGLPNRFRSYDNDCDYVFVCYGEDAR